MANPRKRKTIRNPNRKTSIRQKHRFKTSFQKTIPIIQQNWNPKLTLKQNYERLGLICNLDGSAGGLGNEYESREKEQKRMQQVEYSTIEEFDAKMNNNPSMNGNSSSMNANSSDDWNSLNGIEGIIHLDPKASRIGTKINHLHSTFSDPQPTPSLLKSQIQSILKQQESNFEPVIVKPSDQESLVLKELVLKYKSDYEGMSRDTRLNKYQLSAGQLKRKVMKMNKST